MTTNTYTDKELFNRIAEGDEQAFEQLFHAYVPSLYTAIVKIVRTEPVARDIIQEVFLYLWIDRENLVNIDHPQNWIFKIAYNRSYSWLSKKSSVLEEKYGDNQQYENVSDNQLEELLSLHETNRLIQEAIQQLPDQARRIFQLSRENGLKSAEIGEQLGISVQTVRNSLVRSAKTIKAYLADHDIILPMILIYCHFQ